MSIQIMQTDQGQDLPRGQAGGAGTSSRLAPPNTPLPKPTFPSTTPETNTPPPAPQPEPVVSSISKYITISSMNFMREYVKGSMMNIPPAKIAIKNISSDIKIDVSIRTVSGVTAAPARFALDALEETEVLISFNSSEIEKLHEGINRVVCAVDLSTVSMVIDPAIPENPPITPPESEVGKFLEEKFLFSSSKVKVPDNSHFTGTPHTSRIVNGIAVNTNEEGILMRWTGKIELESGTYSFPINVDDGMRLYLDGRLIFSSWKEQENESYNPTVDVASGIHDLKVEYFNRRGHGRLIFGIQPVIPSQGTTAVKRMPPPSIIQKIGSIFGF